MKVAFECNKHC